MRNIPAARAHGLRMPDFMRALRDHRQHDCFMTTTPPTTMKHRNHGHRGGAIAPVQLVQKSSKASELRVAKVSSSLASGGDKRAAPRGFLPGSHQVVVIHRQAGVGHAAARSPDFEIRLDGNDHEFVLRLPEDRAFGLGHPHHLERKPFTEMLLPIGLALGKAGL